MASKLKSTKSQFENPAKYQNLSIGRGSKQQPCQPNDLEPYQPVLKTNSKQRSYNSTTKVENSTQSPSDKCKTMDKSKFTNRQISSAGKNHQEISKTTSKLKFSKANQASNIVAPATNLQSTRLIQSAKSSLSTKSPSSIPWKSPFKSFTTTGAHRSRCQSQEFSYHLSPDELKFGNTFKSPMKPAPTQERQLLINGQRMEYLTQRYEHSPRFKYNYPEATSWRIGWLQQQQSSVMGQEMKS